MSARPQHILFRQEAIDAHSSHNSGADALRFSNSGNVWLPLTGAALAGAILLFVSLGSYSRQTTVQGILLSEAGLIRIVPAQSGYVTRILVAEGQSVKQGDPIVELSSELHDSSSMQGVFERMDQERRSRIESLTIQLQIQKSVEDADRASLERRRGLLKAELVEANRQRTAQKQRRELSNLAGARQRELLAAGFISKDSLTVREQDMVEQELRETAISRDLISLEREISDIEGQLTTQRMRESLRASEVERQIHSLRQEAIEARARRSTLVLSSANGVVSGLTIQTGQFCQAGKAVARVVSNSSAPQAELYASSTSAAHIVPNQIVAIRVGAFPYQKYGYIEGRVVSVSQAPLADGDEMETQYTSGLARGSYYKVRIELLGDHSEMRLLTGMSLEADIQLESRKIYEWIFEPLIGLRRRST